MIRKSAILSCAPERAFAIFTQEISAWWPPERRHIKDAPSELFLSQAGRFWERADDGREVELGRVRVWEPAARLVLDFYVGTDAAHPTEVEIIFRGEGEGTRIEIEHRALPISGELYKQRAPLFERSWERVLETFASACTR